MNTPAPDEPEKCACEGKDKDKASRRDFLLKIGFGLNAIAAAAIGIPIVGYALSSFVQKFPLKRISLGPVSNFPEGTTRLASYENPYKRSWDGDTAKIPCWVRHISGNEFQVFAINCTHLGCPVRWFDESKLFMCPCHGGVFYEDGTHASGPPPRPLYTYENFVENGELFVKGGILPTLAKPKV
ncbi:MAG: ubiquinol-cytochrome c reductase iron-sulfur subunit [Terrimicrobiaceae bacterium]